jgi:hypothetical protein
MLCNACGTRYRRTGQLGQPGGGVKAAACTPKRAAAAAPAFLLDSGCSSPLSAPFPVKKPRREEEAAPAAALVC